MTIVYPSYPILCRACFHGFGLKNRALARLEVHVLQSLGVPSLFHVMLSFVHYLLFMWHKVYHRV